MLTESIDTLVAAVLPHATAYNVEAAPLAMRQITQALGSGSAPLGHYELGHAVSAKMALRELLQRAWAGCPPE